MESLRPLETPQVDIPHLFPPIMFSFLALEICTIADEDIVRMSIISVGPVHLEISTVSETVRVPVNR